MNKMIDYPKYTVKVIVQMQSRIQISHNTIYEEHIIPMINYNTEIEAVQAAINALRVRYYELENDINE
jgi:hypothetical protein